MEQEINNIEPVTTEQPQDTVGEPIQPAQAAPTPQEERYQSRNFRELREQAERVARERDEAMQRLKSYETQIAIEKQQKNTRTLEFRPDINDDDLIDYKTLKNELQSVRSQLDEYRSVTSNSAAETRLRYDFPDIEQVVTAENIQKLKEREPHLAATIASGRDVYTSGAAAYRAIMGLGILNGERDYSSEKKLATANAQRPRPASTVQGNNGSGESPLARGNMFAPSMTPEQKEQKYKQMREILDRR